MNGFVWGFVGFVCALALANCASNHVHDLSTDGQLT